MDIGGLLDYTLIASFTATTITLIIGLKVSKNNKTWTKTLDYISLLTGGLLLLKTIYIALKQIIIHS